MSKQPLRLYTFGILSRYGFGDGDVLSEYARDVLDIYDCDYGDGNHEPCDLDEELYDIVQHHLLPELNHKVELIFIHTQHNSVRAFTIDGQHVYSNDDPTRLIHEWGEKLTPEYVELSAEHVLSILKEYGYKPGRHRVWKDNE